MVMHVANGNPVIAMVLMSLSTFKTSALVAQPKGNLSRSKKILLGAASSSPSIPKIKSEGERFRSTESV